MPQLDRAYAAIIALYYLCQIQQARILFLMAFIITHPAA